ncbi:MAG TPA: c-type cytochrome, partial [Gammaproteobacteria bacterium]|nr:c-type cytochrome [Gammaproteobacteria bacterium]
MTKGPEIDTHGYRRRIALSVAALATLSAGHVCAQGAQERYNAACAACHGSDGRGRTATQLGFETSIPDFTDCDFAAREPDADWFAIIHDGGPVRGFVEMMPAFGLALDDDEIASILGHVRTFCTNADWPRGDLNMPRALFTEKAYPEDEAVIEGTFNTIDETGTTFNFLWEQRFGTRNQMEISLPISRAEAPNGGTVTGAGDLAVGVKHVLRHSHANGSILSVGGEIILPTGNSSDGFGKDTTIFEPYVSFGKLFGEAAFVQVQAKAEYAADSALNDEYAVRAALGRTWTSNGPFGRSWTPMIELLAARERESGAETHWDVVPQFQVSLNTRQHVLAAFGLRLPVNDRDARDTEIVMY